MKNKELRTLYQETIESLKTSPKTLKSFLEQNSFLHTLTFEDIVLIHGQNPKATLIKTFEKWQEKGSRLRKGEIAIQTLNEFNNPYSKRTSYFDITQLAHYGVELDEILLSEEELSAYLNRLSFEKNESKAILDNYFAYLEETSDIVLKNYSALSESEKDIVPYLAYYNLAVTYNLIDEEEQQILSQTVFNKLNDSNIRLDRVIRVGNNLSMRQSEYINLHYSELQEEAAQLEQKNLDSEIQEYLENKEAGNNSNTYEEIVDVEPDVMETANIISSESEFRNAMIEAYQVLYESYIHKQELKLKGHNVSGAYDTYDIMTSKGAVQFVYNYLGRELGTDDDSKVVFSVGTDNEVFSTTPMSTPIRSRVLEIFEQGLNDLKFVTQEPRVPNENKNSVDLKNQTEQITNDIDILKATIQEFNLGDNYKVIAAGSGSYSLVKESFGGVLNETIINSYEGEFEVLSSISESLTGIDNFEDKFNSFLSKNLVINHSNKVGELKTEENPEELAQLSDEELSSNLTDTYNKMIGGKDKTGASKSAFNYWTKLRNEEIRRIKPQSEPISLFDDSTLNSDNDIKEKEPNASKIDGNIRYSDKKVREISLILLHGSGVEHSKYRIFQYYQNENSLKQLTQFIKNEYGKGVSTSEGKETHYDSSGFTIKSSEFGTYKITWSEVAARIQNLITDDLYLTLDDKEKYANWIIENPLFTESDMSVETKQTNFFGFEQNTADNLIIQDTIQDKKKPSVSQNDTKTLYDFEFPVDLSDFYPKTPVEKVNANLEAIQLVKTLERGNRYALPEEQAILAKYVGWGGLANDFFDENRQKFSSQRKALKSLVTAEEYKSMRQSSLTAYYTDPEIIREMFSDLEARGFKGGRILDPAMGTGNFFSAMPKHLRDNSELYGVELDSITGSIAKQLHQKAQIQIKGFETTDFNTSSFDVVIGNVPFSDFSIKDESYSKSYRIHDYFFKKSLDLTRQGGLVSFITSTGTMDKKSESFRKEIKEVSGLISAIRLPKTAFKKIAGTAVSTDILTLQKGQIQHIDPLWTETTVPRDAEQNLLKNTQANIIFANGESPHIIGDYKVNNFRGQTLVVKENQDLNLINEIKKVYLTQEHQTSYVSYFYSDNMNSLSNRVSNSLFTTGRLTEIPDEVKNLAPQTHIVFDNKIYFNDMVEGIIEKNEAWYQSGFVQEEDENGNLKFDKQGKPIMKNVRGNFDGKTLARLKGMSNISQKVQAIVDYQLNEPAVVGTDVHFEKLLSELNQVYDDFINDKSLKLKEGNVLNARKNAMLFNDDVNFYRMLAIENEIHGEDGKTRYEKGEFFFKKTIAPPASLPVVKTVQDALNLSLSQYGRVNLDFMSEQLSLEVDEVIDQLDEEIYFNPETEEYEPASHYLSGNIYHKLSIIDQKISEGNLSYSHQKEALQKVLPKRLSLHEIDFKLGTRWIPLETYNSFLEEALNNGYRSKMKIEYNSINASYNISNATSKNRAPSYMTTTLYKSLIIKGQESRHNPIHILEDMLNLKNTKITMQIEKEDGSTKTVINPDLTIVASEKQVLLQESFRKWVLAQPELVDSLEDIYNRTYNSTVERRYDGSNLSFGSLTESIQLRAHQKNAVSRVVQEGRGLFAHVVGSGKTLSMIATGMKLKELGRVQKPLYVVPKAVLNQFAADILRAYPDKNIIVPSERDFSRTNRKHFMAKVQMGNYDAVVLTNEQFGRIPLSAERQEEVLQTEIDTIIEAKIAAKENEKGRTTVKQLLQLEKQAKERLEKLQTKKDESPIIFEATGIDFLFLDEAHNFKNLSYTTNISDVKGLSATASQRASDLLGKVRFLQEIHEGGGVVFATGTPVSNSMAEIYTMMKYLEPEVLENHHIRNFDEWASVFARINTKMEVDQTGQKWKPVSRLELQNVPELMTLFRNIADIQTAEMLNLPTPELANDGKPFVHSSELTNAQKDYMEELIYRSEHMPNDPSLDNMLKLTTDARLMATDMRLIDSDFGQEDSTKGQQVAETVHKIWRESKENKSTQLIFSDIGTPKGEKKSNTSISTSDDIDYKFSVYQDIKDKLIDLGIPKEEIAFIHDAKTDKKKGELFEKVRQGDIRILFASTAKGGTGVNIQDKLLAVHHVDVPWRPSDIEQRNGRILRQGNSNPEVQIHHYVTKGTFDTFMWQIQEQKLKFITQVMSGKNASRSMDDLDELVLTASEIKAVTTNNPYIREKMDLENKLANLTILRNSFQSDLNVDKKEIQRLEKNLPLMEEYLENALIDSALAKQYQVQNSEEFSLSLKGHLFTDKEKAGAYLANLAYNAKETETVGKFGGFTILVKPNVNLELTASPLIHLVGENSYSKELNTESGIGSIQRLQTLVSRQIAKAAEKQQKGVENTKEMIQYLQDKVKLPFEKEEEFLTLSKRLAAVDMEITLAVAREEQPRDVTSAVVQEREFEEDYEL